MKNHAKSEKLFFFCTYGSISLSISLYEQFLDLTIGENSRIFKGLLCSYFSGMMPHESSLTKTLDRSVEALRHESQLFS